MHNKALLLMVVLSVVFAASAHAQLVDGYKGKYVMYYCSSAKPWWTFSYEIHKREEGLFEIEGETRFLDDNDTKETSRWYSKMIITEGFEMKHYEVKWHNIKNGEVGAPYRQYDIDLIREGGKTKLVSRMGRREWKKELPDDWLPMFYRVCGISHIVAAAALKPDMVGREFMMLSFEADAHKWRLIDVKRRTPIISGREYEGDAYIFEQTYPWPRVMSRRAYMVIFVRNGEFIAFLETSLAPEKLCRLYMQIVEDFGAEVKFVFPEQFK